MKHLIAVLLAGLSLAAAPTPSWTNTVSQAANGAMVTGNPQAKIRFVEYLSYTCSHCAEFVREAAVPLKRDYVAKGLVSVEVRNAVRDRYDFVAALSARCGGAAKFMGNTELLMVKQGEWLGRVPKFDADNGAAIAKMPMNNSLKFIAHGIGIDALMQTRGIAPAQLNACLIDKAAQQKVVAMTSEAWNERKINGTPTFLVNDSALEGAGHWSVVEPAIKAALGAG